MADLTAAPIYDQLLYEYLKVHLIVDMSYCGKGPLQLTECLIYINICISYNSSSHFCDNCCKYEGNNVKTTNLKQTQKDTGDNYTPYVSSYAVSVRQISLCISEEEIASPLGAGDDFVSCICE